MGSPNEGLGYIAAQTDLGKQLLERDRLSKAPPIQEPVIQNFQMPPTQATPEWQLPIQQKREDTSPSYRDYKPSSNGYVDWKAPTDVPIYRSSAPTTGNAPSNASSDASPVQQAFQATAAQSSGGKRTVSSQGVF